MSEHSRDERHILGAGTHTLRRHTWPLEQSTSASQSTQNPRRVLHTCPGHMREVVHAVVAMQRLPTHARLSVQSVATLHSTQTPDAVLHTWDRALHSRSDMHRVGVTSVGRASNVDIASRPRSIAASAATGGVVVPEQPHNPMSTITGARCFVIVFPYVAKKDAFVRNSEVCAVSMWGTAPSVGVNPIELTNHALCEVVFVVDAKCRGSKRIHLRVFDLRTGERDR
jgi:hypothetical protein